MYCQNKFCIYQSKDKCILNNISIDESGMCTECIYPNIDTNILEQAKNELLKKYEQLDNK